MLLDPDADERLVHGCYQPRCRMGSIALGTFLSAMNMLSITDIEDHPIDARSQTQPCTLEQS